MEQRNVSLVRQQMAKIVQWGWNEEVNPRSATGGQRYTPVLMVRSGEVKDDLTEDRCCDIC